MAKSATIEYSRSAVYGSLAYDIPEIVEVPGTESETIPQEQSKPVERESEKVRVGTKAAVRVSVSPVTAIGAVIAVVLAIMITLSYVQLNEISAESAEYVAQLEELQQEQTQLTLQYESAFDYREIEEYAVNELGMVKMTSSQKVYFSDDLEEDKAVIIDVESDDSSIWSTITGIFSSIKEFFS